MSLGSKDNHAQWLELTQNEPGVETRDVSLHVGEKGVSVVHVMTIKIREEFSVSLCVLQFL